MLYFQFDHPVRFGAICKSWPLESIAKITGSLCIETSSTQHERFTRTVADRASLWVVMRNRMRSPQLIMRSLRVQLSWSSNRRHFLAAAQIYLDIQRTSRVICQRHKRSETCHDWPEFELKPSREKLSQPLEGSYAWQDVWESGGPQACILSLRGPPPSPIHKCSCFQPAQCQNNAALLNTC